MTFFGPDIRNGLPIGLGSVAGFGRRAFTPSVLFAAGEQGFWYDPSDRGTLFQDSAGITPVTAVEQAVGLVLDKSRGLVIGPELVTNGGPFTATTGWAGENATLSVVSGKLRVTSSAAGFASAYQTLSGLVANGWYVVAATVQRISGSGTAYVRFYDTAPTTTPIAGPFFSSTTAAASGAAYFQASADGQITLNLAIASAAAANETADFNLVSVRAVPGNHAIQPGATNRPILRSRYNLLTYSEDFSNAAWVKDAATVSANAALAPDGTMTADKIIPTAAASTVHRAYQNTAASGLPTGLVRVGVWVKADGYSWAKVRAGAAYVNVDLLTGAAGVTSNAGSVSITPANNGYYRVTYVPSTSLQSSQVYVYPMTDNNTGLDATSFTGDGTSGVLAWGCEVVLNNDTYLPYQRIAAATDYDTVGFPVYLAFDGSDDSLYTGGNVDFTGTSKLAVFAGVTKLSDGARGSIVESGASYAAGGTFGLLHSNGAAANYQFGVSGTTGGTVDVAPTTYTAPNTAVLSAQFDTVGAAQADQLKPRIDGVDASGAGGVLCSGTFGNVALYIGRRNNATLPFNGRLYQLIGRGAATSAALIQQADRWVAGKQGRAL